MKKFFSILSIALIAAVGFTACSDDDDDPTLADYAKGTYSVNIESEVLTAITPGTVVLAKTGAAVVDLKLEGFKFGELVIPVALKGAALTGTKDEVKITSTVQDVTIKIGETPVTVKVQVTEGKVVGKSLTLKINVKDIPGTEADVIVNVTSRTK